MSEEEVGFWFLLNTEYSFDQVEGILHGDSYKLNFEDTYYCTKSYYTNGRKTDVVSWTEYEYSTKYFGGSAYLRKQWEEEKRANKEKEYARICQSYFVDLKDFQFLSPEAILGAIGATASELYYSEKLGIWMGRNFKLYKLTWGGNRFVGGKFKFGKKTSKNISRLGYLLGLYNAINIYNQYKNNKISASEMIIEEFVNGLGTAGGLYGASFNLGWELGRVVSTTNWYQNL